MVDGRRPNDLNDVECFAHARQSKVQRVCLIKTRRVLNWLFTSAGRPVRIFSFPLSPFCSKFVDNRSAAFNGWLSSVLVSLHVYLQRLVGPASAAAFVGVDGLPSSF